MVWQQLWLCLNNTLENKKHLHCDIFFASTKNDFYFILKLIHLLYTVYIIFLQNAIIGNKIRNGF